MLTEKVLTKIDIIYKEFKYELTNSKNSKINKEFQKSVKVKKILRLKKVLNEERTSPFQGRKQFLPFCNFVI